MKPDVLTIKEENASQAYIRLGDKSAAYREAYSCSNMKPETINRRAFDLFNKGKIKARIEFLQSEIVERNKVTIDEVVENLADMLRFDIGELYDDQGRMKPLKQIPKSARLMISSVETEEVKVRNSVVGITKKVKIFDKLGAIEKLMKHLGGYKVDNEQKAPLIQISGMRIVKGEPPKKQDGN